MLNKCCIIIVTYNAECWLNYCLSSIQNYKKFQIVIVDNNSTDNTCSIIQKNFPDIILYKNNKNLGFGAANNIGLKYAYEHKYQHVLLLNQDAKISIESIEKLIEYQEKYPEYDILTPLHYNGTEKFLDKGFEQYIRTAPEYINDLIIGKELQTVYKMSYCNAACWLLSYNCLATVGGFSPTFYHYGEDDNYLDRLFYHNKKLGVVPSLRVFHNREYRNDTNSPFNTDMETFYRCKIIKPLSNPNNIFYKRYIRLLFSLLIKIISKFLLFNFRSSFIYCKLLVLLIRRSRIIYKNLMRSKNVCAFLED